MGMPTTTLFFVLHTIALINNTGSVSISPDGSHGTLPWDIIYPVTPISSATYQGPYKSSTNAVGRKIKKDHFESLCTKGLEKLESLRGDDTLTVTSNYTFGEFNVVLIPDSNPVLHNLLECTASNGEDYFISYSDASIPYQMYYKGGPADFPSSAASSLRPW